jgi:hypothetical protein
MQWDVGNVPHGQDAAERAVVWLRRPRVRQLPLHECHPAVHCAEFSACSRRPNMASVGHVTRTVIVGLGRSWKL